MGRHVDTLFKQNVTTSVTLHILAETLAHSTWAELHRPDSSEHHPTSKDKLLHPSPQQVTDMQLREKSALKVHLVTMVHVFVGSRWSA